MNSEQKAILAGLIAALVCFLAGGWFGYSWGTTRAQKGQEQQADTTSVETQLDTTTTQRPKVDTVTLVKWKTKYLPLPPADPEDEPMDTIDNPYDNPPDSAAVEIPISRYVAEQDSLYRVVATGYDVDFEEITVYPRTTTITLTRTVGVPKANRWGIGVQAGYGATLQDNTVKLAPYIGVGISYNIITW